jgi:hypothetical protein
LKFCKIISASIIYSVYFVQPSRAEGRIRIRTYNNGSVHVLSVDIITDPDPDPANCHPDPEHSSFSYKLPYVLKKELPPPRYNVLFSGRSNLDLQSFFWLGFSFLAALLFGLIWYRFLGGKADM